MISKDSVFNIVRGSPMLQKIKEELEAIGTLHNSLIQEVRPQEKMESMAELDMLEFEEKLLKIQRENEELKRAFSHRDKRVEGQASNLIEDHSRMLIEKDRTISELKTKLEERKNQTKLKDIRMVEMAGELHRLNCQKLAADKEIEEMRRQQLMANQVVEELRLSILEAYQSMGDLRRQKVEAENVAEACKNNVRKLISRIRVVVEEVSIGMDDLMNFNGRKGLQHSGQPAATDVIEIVDNDDQTNLQKTDEKAEVITQQPSPDLRDNQIGKDCRNISPIGLSTKRKRSTDEFDDHNPPAHGDIQKQISAKSNGSDAIGLSRRPSAGMEDSEDESCSTPRINALIRSQKRQNVIKAWKFETDMQNALREDDEFCLNAVCMLYKYQMSAESTKFYHFQALSGHDLGKYLTDVVPKLRLRKSLSEVKQERPDVIDQCRTLAMDYNAQLFSMYCVAENPFLLSS